MICQNIHGNSECQYVGTAYEDKDKNGACSREFFSYTSSDQFSAVSKRLHLRISDFELADDPAGVGCDDAKEADAKHAWYKAKDRKGLRKRENA